MTLQNRIYQSQIRGLQENTGSGYQKLTPDQALRLYKSQIKRRGKVSPIQNPEETPWFDPAGWVFSRPEGGHDDVVVRDPDHTRQPTWNFDNPDDPNPTVGGMPWHQYYLDPNAPLPQPERKGHHYDTGKGLVRWSGGAGGGMQESTNIMGTGTDAPGGPSPDPNFPPTGWPGSPHHGPPEGRPYLPGGMDWPWWLDPQQPLQPRPAGSPPHKPTKGYMWRWDPIRGWHEVPRNAPFGTPWYPGRYFPNPNSPWPYTV